MRYETTPTRTLSLVTTKGQYLNGKGKVTHHPRNIDVPTRFICVDGEGMTVNGEHRYVLFGVGDQQISNVEELSWREIFAFLYGQYRPKTASVGFFLGYDFTQIFKTLPEQAAWFLLTTEGQALRKHRLPGKPPHPVMCDGWLFDILAGKRLRIRPKTCTCEYATCPCKKKPWIYICDVGSFFQSSFLSVIDPKKWTTPVVTAEEYAIIEAGKTARATAVLDSTMMEYNRLENEILARVMGTLDAGFRSIGVKLAPSEWFGPGQAAQKWLKHVGVEKTSEYVDDIPPWFLEAARMSYMGGWFEPFMHGPIPGPSYEYDINSAYPATIATLPCLRHGTYTRGTGLPPKDTDLDRDLTLVYARVGVPLTAAERRRTHIGAMLHRDKKGRIYRPIASQGWYWWDEIQAAYRAGMLRRPGSSGRQKWFGWVRYRPCDCPPPMRGVTELYAKRLEWGKNTPQGKAAKLVYNSMYGKFAQSVGNPMFGNPIYASRITSRCRTAICDAIATHPVGKAHVEMVATDAVYFLTPHTSLPLSDKLGEWEEVVKHNLTIFKPGVYWDDAARKDIEEGKLPRFKARGVSARDFAQSLARIDEEFAAWNGTPGKWPVVTFTPSFAMTTALQALRRKRWDTAGAVDTSKPLQQDSNPEIKRTNIHADTADGRLVYRSEPHEGVHRDWDDSGSWVWEESVPYQKRFGLEDPWSEESRDQWGVTPDGNFSDLVAWILHAEPSKEVD